MLYSTESLDLKELQVVAATSLMQRSADNEIALTASNLQLQNVVARLQQELAQLRNTGMVELQGQIAQLEKQLADKTHECEEILQQFGNLKHNYENVVAENRKMKESAAPVSPASKPKKTTTR